MLGAAGCHGRLARPCRAAVLTCRIAAVALLALAQCVGVPVGRYDAESDRALAALAADFETLFADLADAAVSGPLPPFADFAGRYRALEVPLDRLALRRAALAAAGAPDPRGAEQIALLRANLDRLAALHREGLEPPELLDVLRAQFRAALGAMAAWELAKPRAP